MRSLPVPTIKNLDTLKSVIESKHEESKESLKRIQKAVKCHYREYLKHAPSFEHLSKNMFSTKEEEELRNCYDNPTKPKNALWAEIMSPREAFRCPFCGIGEWDTVDHFLPKAVHPEFAIFAPNLVPACNKCNLKKGSKIWIPGEENLREFNHPYYDEIPRVSLVDLDIDLRVDAMVLKFRLVQSSLVSEVMFARIANQFKKLDLADRYRRNSFLHLREIRRPINSSYGHSNDAELVAQELKGRAGDFERDYGINHFLAVLYRRLSDHNEFCDGGFKVLDAVQ